MQAVFFHQPFLCDPFNSRLCEFCTAELLGPYMLPCDVIDIDLINI